MPGSSREHGRERARLGRHETPATTDIDTLKARLKATWMNGNYDYFSRFMESSASSSWTAWPHPPAPRS